MLIPKVFRFLVPEEIRALLEKIDSINTPIDSSYYEICSYIRQTKLRRIEEKFLLNALNRVERDHALAQAMHIVIYNKMERNVTDYDIKLDLKDVLLRNSTVTNTVTNTALGTVQGQRNRVPAGTHR